MNGNLGVNAALRRSLTALVVAVAVAAIGGSVQSASATTSSTSYTLTQVDGPQTVEAGASASFTFTLENCVPLLDPACTLAALTSADVAPEGFVVTKPADGARESLTSALAKNWAIKNDKNVLQLRAADDLQAIVPLDHLDFTVMATAPCAAGTYTWSSDATADPATVVQSTATHFVVTVPSSPSPFAAEVGQEFSVTVTAKNAYGCTATSYAGPATLSGNLAGATYGPLTFEDGVATGTVIPAKSELGRSVTVTDDGNQAITGTSATFDVFDELVATCSSAGCSGSVANASTAVDVAVPPKEGAGGFLGLSLSDPSQTISCTRLDGSPIAKPTMGSLWTIVPPAGYEQPTITATVRYSKSVAPGTGVANFVICKNAGGDTPFHELAPCPKKGASSDPCISKRTRNGVGDLVITVLINSVDPIGGGYD